MSQHDYNIANQSFPSFRTDLNNVLGAINSSNSGTSRPSGAVAGTIWLDTSGGATAHILKFYDGSDDINLATINTTANTVDFTDSTVTLGANSVDSDQYVDGSIDTEHLSDNLVTLAKMASGTDGNLISYDASGDPVAVATGTSGQVLTSAGSGAPPVFADAAGGGAMDKLAEVVADDDATVSFDGFFSSTYDNYIIYASEVTAITGGQFLYTRFRRSNADITTNNYVAVTDGAERNISTDASGNTYNAGEAAFGRIAGSQSSSDTAASSGTWRIEIPRPLNTTGHKRIAFQSSTISDGEIVYGSNFGSVWLKDAVTALSGITFYFSSGNVKTGIFQLYGIKA